MLKGDSMHTPTPSNPAIRVALPSSSIAASLARPRVAAESEVPARRVLLGVSDVGMRRVLGSPLRAEGFDIVEAGDVTELLGALALSMVQGRWHEPVDAIVCDAREDDSILEAIEKLRSAGWMTPVVVIVRQGDFETAQVARALGASHAFHTPFHAVDLRAMVRKMITAKHV